MLIRFQVGKPKRTADRDCLEKRYLVISAGARRPYLCGVTGPEYPVLVSTDRSENYTCQAGEGSNGDLAHTKRVDQEIVLDLVYVPEMGSVGREKQVLTETYRKSTFLPVKPTSRSSFNM